MEPITYSLQLNTDENIEVLEIDPDRVPILSDDEIRQVLSPVLDHCSYVTRLSIEEAKKCHPKKLELLLRTPPIGALVKLNMLCSQINDCPMSSRKECTTKNIAKKYGKFPICWTYDAKLLNNKVEADDLIYHIVHAWRLGQYVLIISS